MASLAIDVSMCVSSVPVYFGVCACQCAPLCVPMQELGDCTTQSEHREKGADETDSERAGEELANGS